MELKVKENPGATGISVMCPNCSKMYSQEEELPRKCKRCQAPMDAKEAKKFAQERSVAEQTTLSKQVQNSLPAFSDALISQIADVVLERLDARQK